MFWATCHKRFLKTSQNCHTTWKKYINLLRRLKKCVWPGIGTLGTVIDLLTRSLTHLEMAGSILFVYFSYAFNTIWMLSWRKNWLSVLENLTKKAGFYSFWCDSLQHWSPTGNYSHSFSFSPSTWQNSYFTQQASIIKSFLVTRHRTDNKDNIQLPNQRGEDQTDGDGLSSHTGEHPGDGC